MATTRKTFAQRIGLDPGEPGKRDCAQMILEFMEFSWDTHGSIGEPYSEATAIEVAINELFDYAMERGLVVKTQGVEIQPFGVTVSAED
jgi:hypothetical protein